MKVHGGAPIKQLLHVVFTVYDRRGSRLIKQRQQTSATLYFLLE